MKKLLVYPFQDELSPICRFSDMVEGFTEILPVAPRSFGLNGQDVAKCDGGEETNIVVRSDFSDSLLQCETVFLDLARGFSLSEDHYNKIVENALTAGKGVIMTAALKKFLLDHGNINYDDKVQTMGYSDVDLGEIKQKKLYDIPTPCITVLGTGDKSNKFDLQIGIANYFKQRGYNVCLFGTKEYSKLFGFDPLPAFLFRDGNQKEKILRFNHFIYEQSKERNPDLFIIGCPGAIMQDTPLVFNEYGELAFVIGNALMADASILSVYAGAYNERATDYLRELCKYRVNADVRRVNLACKSMSVDQATMEFNYVTINHRFINEQIIPHTSVGEMELFVGLSKGEMNRLGASLEAELLNNIG